MKKKKIIRVAVLVDLFLNQQAGGHVKYWQRISESISFLKIDYHLTIFFLGFKNEKSKINKNINYVTIKPVVSSGMSGGIESARPRKVTGLCR